MSQDTSHAHIEEVAAAIAEKATEFIEGLSDARKDRIVELESLLRSARHRVSELSSQLSRRHSQIYDMLDRFYGHGPHPFDPDPYGLHGLSADHRQAWIRFAEQEQLVFDGE